MGLDHDDFMRLALDQAKDAARANEVPVGAALVSEAGRVLARSQNEVIRRTDPCAHAEILAIREAARKIGNFRLLNTALYVTIEPCLMCMGAILHARIAHLIFGAPDPKWGAAGSLYDFSKDTRLNHRVTVTGGILERAAKDLIQAFFKTKRG